MRGSKRLVDMAHEPINLIHTKKRASTKLRGIIDMANEHVILTVAQWTMESFQHFLRLSAAAFFD